MIALRGTLKQKPVDEKSAALDASPTTSTTTASSSSSSTSVWCWEGLWAFGTIESPNKGRGAASTTVKKPKPYYYSWVKSQSASTTPVPSLNFPKPKEEENERKISLTTTPRFDEDNAAAAKTSQESSEAPTTTNAGSVDEKKQSSRKGGEKMEKKDPEPMGSTTEEGKAVMTTEQLETQDGTKDSNQLKSSQPALTPQATTPKKLLDSPAPEKDTIITFASMLSPDDPRYTEASSSSYTCPPDGAWKGHFENAVKRRYPISDRNKIAENFCLFFNATPPKDARVLFPTPIATNETKKKMEEKIDEQEFVNLAKLPAGHVHVRGMGTNQFGTFELIGSWDPETGQLACQKMYVVNPHKSPRKPRSSSSSKAKRIDVTPAAGGGDSSAIRQSRKRHLSWRKRESIEEEELRKMLAKQQKRPRPSMPATPASTPAATADSLASALKIVVPTGTATTMPSKRVSPKGAVVVPAAPRRARTSPRPAARGGVTATAQSSFSSTVTLPSVPDPNLARWRAAHFLYYDNSNESIDKSPTSPHPAGSSTTSANFVVYEGEMLLGQREGRGVCLYNGNTLYEGDWKRNQEHGKGTLMSADRTRIIYEGEWERGRMQGHGTYYYNELYSSTEGLGKSRYEGDFKEGKRHGTGKYYLPDGSSYDGEWRDDAMSGTGTFRWPGGSVYVGNWRGSKRHGEGVLHASDGFVYDGNWVNNTMEGRGTATYPNGQRYQGLWSCGRREGRGTIHFVNGAIYEGRFRDDCIEGQGTMKMTENAMVPRQRREADAVSSDGEREEDEANEMQVESVERKDDWMIPISFQSDMGHIHRKAGFTIGGE